MQNDFLTQINRILERESKSATYKFALLRCVIEVIQEKSPFIIVSESSVSIPLCLLIEKWILAYYPIFEANLQHSQINGSSVRLAFETEMLSLVDYYKNRGGISVLNRDLKIGFPDDVLVIAFNLIKKLKTVITKNPMRYIGSTIFNEEYSLFKVNKNNCRFTNLSNPIKDIGTFSISRNYYDGFNVLGSFITGQDSILSKWADFSTRVTNDKLDKTLFIERLLEMPVVKRDQAIISNYFMGLLQSGKKLNCVWSGKEITSSLNAEHIFPFSLWKNNDLWNLLPSLPKVNALKRDKIPSPKLIEKQKDVIQKGWELYFPLMEMRFKKEFVHALSGINEISLNFDHGIKRLKEISEYLIDVRGYEVWNGTF